MGWAWHKLYPQTSTSYINCPPDFVCPACEENCTGTICYGYCPGGGGVGLCQLETCIPIGGPNCSYPYVPNRTWGRTPGTPFDYRMQVPLFCTGPNDISTLDINPLNPCDYEQNAQGFPYYYASPSSPSSPPTSIRKQPICLFYNMYGHPSRVQVISGYNRYRYGGYMAPGANCDAPYSMIPVGVRNANAECAQNLIVGSLPTNGAPDFQNVPYGVTGISGMEGSLGRQFPLPDAVLTYALFGGVTSSYGEGECGLLPEIPNPAYTLGHYSSNTLGAQKGSYSFQCFNTHSYYKDGLSYAAVGIPTCSVWSLLHAIYYKIHAGMSESVTILNPAHINDKIKPDWWKTVTPTGLSADNTQMVRWVMNRFATGVAEQGIESPSDSSLFGNFVIPNIFLWNKTEHDNAGTTADKWKHIYVIGNANIITDTSCTGTASYDAGDDPAIGTGTYTSVGGSRSFFLDECCHAGKMAIQITSDADPTGRWLPRIRNPHNARLLYAPGCDPDGGEATGSQWDGHTANFFATMSGGWRTMGCVPYHWENAPQTGYCRQCLSHASDGNPDANLKECPNISTYNGHLDGSGNPKDGCDPSR